MTNVRAVLLMKMINKVLRRWMPHTNTHTERRATSFFYHGGDETTDQSRLSAAWQRRKSEGVIEEVSWPCGAVSVACLSGGRHWWTVEAERERERELNTHSLSHTHTCQVITEGWKAFLMFLTVGWAFASISTMYEDHIANDEGNVHVCVCVCVCLHQTILQLKLFHAVPQANNDAT